MAGYKGDNIFYNTLNCPAIAEGSLDCTNDISTFWEWESTTNPSLIDRLHESLDTGDNFTTKYRESYLTIMSESRAHVVSKSGGMYFYEDIPYIDEDKSPNAPDQADIISTVISESFKKRRRGIILSCCRGGGKTSFLSYILSCHTGNIIKKTNNIPCNHLPVCKGITWFIIDSRRFYTDCIEKEVLVKKDEMQALKKKYIWFYILVTSLIIKSRNPEYESIYRQATSILDEDEIQIIESKITSSLPLNNLSDHDAYSTNVAREFIWFSITINRSNHINESLITASLSDIRNDYLATGYYLILIFDGIDNLPYKEKFSKSYANYLESVGELIGRREIFKKTGICTLICARKETKHTLKKNGNFLLVDFKPIDVEEVFIRNNEHAKHKILSDKLTNKRQLKLRKKHLSIRAKHYMSSLEVLVSKVARNFLVDEYGKGYNKNLHRRDIPDGIITELFDNIFPQPNQLNAARWIFAGDGRNAQRASINHYYLFMWEHKLKLIGSRKAHRMLDNIYLSGRLLKSTVLEEWQPGVVFPNLFHFEGHAEGRWNGLLCTRVIQFLLSRKQNKTSKRSIVTELTAIFGYKPETVQTTISFLVHYALIDYTSGGEIIRLRKKGLVTYILHYGYSRFIYYASFDAPLPISFFDDPIDQQEMLFYRDKNGDIINLFSSTFIINTHKFSRLVLQAHEKEMSGIGGTKNKKALVKSRYKLPRGFFINIASDCNYFFSTMKNSKRTPSGHTAYNVISNYIKNVQS